MRLARMKPLPREALEIAKLIQAATKKPNAALLNKAIDLIGRRIWG